MTCDDSRDESCAPSADHDNRLLLQLRSAQEEISFIRGKARELSETRFNALRETIAAQTELIDDRDRYIIELEARVGRQAEQLEVVERWLRRAGPVAGVIRAAQARSADRRDKRS